jgi:hypothetical protein
VRRVQSCLARTRVRSTGTLALRSTIASCTSMAQRTASTTERNSTRAPSTAPFTARALWTAIVGSISRSAMRAAARACDPRRRRFAGRVLPRRRRRSRCESTVFGHCASDSNSTITRSESSFSANKRQFSAAAGTGAQLRSGAPTGMMGWTAPRTASACQDGRCRTISEGKPSMGKSIRNLSTVTRVGLDLAKRVFQVHAVEG